MSISSTLCCSIDVKSCHSVSKTELGQTLIKHKTESYTQLLYIQTLYTVHQKKPTKVCVKCLWNWPFTLSGSTSVKAEIDTWWGWLQNWLRQTISEDTLKSCTIGLVTLTPGISSISVRAAFTHTLSTLIHQPFLGLNYLSWHE